MAGPTPKNSFSFSRIKTLKQCPARYRYRYVKGMREAFRSVESYLGNTVHDVLEWLYITRDAESTPELDSALQVLEERWQGSLDDKVAIVRISESFESYLDLGREMLDRFYEKTFLGDRSQTLALEVRLSRKLSPDVVFTGFADRIGRTEKGRLFVVDYKTSRNMGDPSELSEGLQAPLYAACALDKHDALEALAGYHYLRHGTTRWQSVDTARAEELMARFKELADEALAATDFPANPGILCAWCGFNAVCDEARVPDDLAGGLRHALGE